MKAVVLVGGLLAPFAPIVAIAPHVFVEELCLEEIRRARDRYRGSGLRERMTRHHRNPDAAFYGWNDVWLHPDFPRWSIIEEIPQIESPLLLIQGERDEYGTLAQLDAIERAAKVPIARVHLDCGHSPPLEKPAETVEAIVRWLEPSG